MIQIFSRQQRADLTGILFMKPYKNFQDNILQAFSEAEDGIRKLIAEKKALQQEVQELKEEVSALRELLKTQERQEGNNNRNSPPKTFEGWDVEFSERGFYQLKKEVGDSVPHTLYIGKEWDPVEARKKISVYEDFPKMVYLVRSPAQGRPLVFCGIACARESGYEGMPGSWNTLTEEAHLVCTGCGKAVA